LKKIITLLLCLFAVSLIAQSDSERYSTVGISMDDFHQLVADQSHGLAIDHFHKNEDKLLEFVFSESELHLLKARDINYQVIIGDYKQHFRNLVRASEGKKVGICALDNFDAGDMGGYHTYDQMIAHINLMQAKYSDLVTATVIGESIEGREIWSVKISDNPQLDESDQEGVVYFEAVTHAREPMSLEATLYYMWWLLENSTTNEEAIYLINNREIYFVPIVNPDGYVFNEINDPMGGGLWRKNRYDAGNDCFGVDLNRNYPKGWGLNSGSSNDPCSNTYRGQSPLSEPESAAIVDFVAQIEPAIAFSSHTYGDKFLSPWGYVDSLASFEMYAEFVSEFIPTTYDGYGTTAKMLSYTSSGTTRDYLHTQDVLAWTPEIGHSFWESPDVICDRVQEFLKPMQYLTWVSGDYACFHDFTLRNNQVWTGDTIALDIRIKNRGLSQPALDTWVMVTTNHPAVNTINGFVTYGTIEARQYSESIDAPFTFEITGVLNPSERIPFTVEVYAKNSLSYSKEIYITAGEEQVIYKTDFEMDNAWLVPAMEWDTSFMDATSGFHSFADSRYGNYLANSNQMVVMNEPIDLSTASFPFVSFNAKWALEPNYDFARFMISPNGVNNWTTLPGLYTDENNLYNQNKHWVQERIDLTQFIGQSEVYLAFLLEADQNVHSDGIYIDDFKVSDYFEPIMSSVDDPKIQLSQLRLVPNPAMAVSILSLNAHKVMSAQLNILGLNGELILNDSIKLNAGMNNISLDLSLMTTGVYIVQVTTEDGISQLKLVVGL
jgi:carboxypeptidase T